MSSQKSLQEQIDAITWYHEFDFGNGLKATSKTPDAANHRVLWDFIRGELDKIDFEGKTVLDTGCWDGYWSFYAEKRGAKSVYASDDQTQNWAQSSGVLLAKQLLDSKVEVDLNRSVYDLESIGRKFDIVLNLGVYYHLIDPYYSFAQLRHCCHEETIVVVEGDATLGLPPNAVMYDLSDHSRSTFIPTPHALNHMLRGSYLDVVRQPWHAVPPKTDPNWMQRLRMVWEEQPEVDPQARPARLGRLLTVCKPFDGKNELHMYKPPFGLERYDPRFR